MSLNHFGQFEPYSIHINDRIYNKQKQQSTNV